MLPAELRQVTIFNTKQLRARGVAPSELRSAVSEGTLVRLKRGWFTHHKPERPADQHRLRVLAELRDPLGGAMAADYAARNGDRLAGLVLLAAYPAEGVDLSGNSFGALSLLAEHDTVASADKVREGVSREGPGSRLEVIPGAVHAFFGRYGPQAGDGVPTVNRADAEAAIVEKIVGYLAPLG